MARVLQYQQRSVRWLLAWLLTLAAGRLEAAAARLATRMTALEADARREVEVIDIDGRRYGAIYEDGVLVGLTEVDRL